MIRLEKNCPTVIFIAPASLLMKVLVVICASKHKIYYARGSTSLQDVLTLFVVSEGLPPSLRKYNVCNMPKQDNRVYVLDDIRSFDVVFFDFDAARLREGCSQCEGSEF